MGEAYLEAANIETAARLKKLRSSLADAQTLLGNMGCVYATGSFGRLEAGSDSDLDVFIVVKTYKKDNDDAELFRLKETEQIKLKCHIIDAARVLEVADFDGGGRFLATHAFGSYREYLGSPEDDYRNTLTGRMLLLLESKFVIGERVYKELLDDVIAGYFRDYTGNEDKFLPTFLCNDILRMWRTFCVNYEFFRRDGKGGWKIKNLKLKYSRMLTCYSAVIELLYIHRMNGTVNMSDVREMVSRTPTERIKFVEKQASLCGHGNANAVEELTRQALADYSSFLELVHRPKAEALQAFESDEDRWREQSYLFGEKLARLMSAICDNRELENPLFRLIVV